MSVGFGGRVLAIVLTVTPAASLACALNCSEPVTQASAHDCHGAPVTVDLQVSAGDSCGDHPAPVAILTQTSRHAQTQLTTTVIDALTWSPFDVPLRAFFADLDTGRPFHARLVTGLRI